MSLGSLNRDWDDLATLDPLWAILSHKDRKFGKWELNEFFSTGKDEIEKIMKTTEELGYPTGGDVALDFGCGVGRLTRFLAKNFRQCYGVDISEIMIAKAREFNSSIQNCKFIPYTGEDLQMFKDDCLDFIYTSLVLQHLPDKKMIKSYISEFIRTLKKGGLLVFQLPHSFPIKHKAVHVKRLVYVLLNSLGFNKKFIFKKLNLTSMRLNFIPENEVIEFLESKGATVLKIQINSAGGVLNQSRTYFATK